MQRSGGAGVADTSGEGPSNDAAAPVELPLRVLGGWRPGACWTVDVTHTARPCWSSSGGLARIVMLNGPVPTVAEMTWRTVASQSSVLS